MKADEFWSTCYHFTGHYVSTSHNCITQDDTGLCYLCIDEQSCPLRYSVLSNSADAELWCLPGNLPSVQLHINGSHYPDNDPTTLLKCV